MKIPITVILFLLLIANHAFCDEVYTYLRVECSPSKKTMTITPKSELNNRRSLKDHGPVSKDLGKDRKFIVSTLIKESGICNLDKSLKIKLDSWLGVVIPNGQCGAGPPSYLSVKINGKKLIETEVEHWCGGITLKSLTLSPAGIELCTYEEPSYQCDWVPENPEPKWQCELRKLPNHRIQGDAAKPLR